MNKRAWLIIGDGNTKKSSVARGLTAAGNPKTWVEIETKSGLRFSLRLFVSSVQEVGLDPEEMLTAIEEPPKSIPTNKPIKDCLSLDIRNALILLRMKPFKKGGVAFPSAFSYVEKLIKNGWTINAVIVLGEEVPDWIRLSGLEYMAIPESVKLPGAVVANRVRQSFQWC